MTGLSYADRQQSGKALRKSVPRSAHGLWAGRQEGHDVIGMLEGSCRANW